MFFFSNNNVSNNYNNASSHDTNFLMKQTTVKYSNINTPNDRYLRRKIIKCTRRTQLTIILVNMLMKISDVLVASLLIINSDNTRTISIVLLDLFIWWIIRAYVPRICKKKPNEICFLKKHTTRFYGSYTLPSTINSASNMNNVQKALIYNLTHATNQIRPSSRSGSVNQLA